MSMEKISPDELKEIVRRYKLHICRIEGTEVINVRKHRNEKYVDIEWGEFERILKKRKLAIYKAANSDFIKLMKDKP
jgi:hypothetical protein